MRFTSDNPRLDGAERTTTALAVVVSSGLYARYRHPYLARGVLGDIIGLVACSVALVARRKRLRHEAFVCLAAIGAVHLVRPRWPLRFADALSWSGIALALTGYLRFRQSVLR